MGRQEKHTLWLQNKSDCSRSLFAVSAFPPFPNLRDFLPLVRNTSMRIALERYLQSWGSPDLSINFKNWFCLLRKWHIVNSFLVVLSGILKFWKAAGRGEGPVNGIYPLRSKDQLPTLPFHKSDTELLPQSCEKQLPLSRNCFSYVKSVKYLPEPLIKILDFQHSADSVSPALGPAFQSARPLTSTPHTAFLLLQIYSFYLAYIFLLQIII